MDRTTTVCVGDNVRSKELFKSMKITFL